MFANCCCKAASTSPRCSHPAAFCPVVSNTSYEKNETNAGRHPGQAVGGSCLYRLLVTEYSRLHYHHHIQLEGLTGVHNDCVPVLELKRVLRAQCVSPGSNTWIARRHGSKTSAKSVMTTIGLQFNRRERCDALPVCRRTRSCTVFSGIK